VLNRERPEHSEDDPHDVAAEMAILNLHECPRLRPRPLVIVTSTESARIRGPTADAISAPPLPLGRTSLNSLSGESLLSLPGTFIANAPRPTPPRALLAPFTAAICDDRCTSKLVGLIGF
jgi:hypothetical protein